jgi:hypothetical protein
VPIANIEDVIKVFEDEGTIAAVLWRDDWGPGLAPARGLCYTW